MGPEEGEEEEVGGAERRAERVSVLSWQASCTAGRAPPLPGRMGWGCAQVVVPPGENHGHLSTGSLNDKGTA